MNDVLGALGKDYSGIIIGNGGYSGDSALRDIEASKADMISFGRLFISNPDLAQRIIHRWPINENYEMKTFYSGGSNGYTDYPFSTFNRFPYKDA
jgi:N-ethylmaleimide reductase